jgi:hypothetical protein
MPSIPYRRTSTLTVQRDAVYLIRDRIHTLRLYGKQTNKSRHLYEDLKDMHRLLLMILMLTACFLSNTAYADSTPSVTTTLATPTEVTIETTTISSTTARPSTTMQPILTNDTLTITELTLENSVIADDDVAIKIPQGYRYIRTKINFGKWYS